VYKKLEQFVLGGELNRCLSINVFGIEMNLSKKATLVMVTFIILLVPLGQLSPVHSDLLQSQPLEARAFACLTDVYPLNLTHYNITLGTVCMLPTAPSDTFVAQSINYNLNSPDSNLVANFMFKDSKLYQLSLSIINGSVSTARPYNNLTDAARGFLVKYQAFSHADSTDLIRLLDYFEETKNTTVTLGNISLRVSHLVIPTVGNNGTTFQWIYTLNGRDDTVVDLSFSDSIFGSFIDTRQLYTVGSEEAIGAAMKYIYNFNGTQEKVFNVNKGSVVAEFLVSSRNDNIYPYWRVTLNADQIHNNVNGLQLDVWADSGEVFNCTNQAVSSIQVHNSQIDFALIGTATTITVLAIALAIAFIKRKYHSPKYLYL
jgi:hypothetical protein